MSPPFGGAVRYLGFLLGLDALVRKQDDGGLEDEDDGQYLDVLLDLSESVAGVQPLDRAVHLQLRHAQVHRLYSPNTHSIGCRSSHSQSRTLQHGSFTAYVSRTTSLRCSSQPPLYEKKYIKSVRFH